MTGKREIEEEILRSIQIQIHDGQTVTTSGVGF